MPNYNSISRYNLTTATIINYVDKIKTLLSNNNIIKIKLLKFKICCPLLFVFCLYLFYYR